MYAGIAEYLGFQAYSDEGKLMGLAAYGHYDEKIERVFKDIIDIIDII